MTKHNTIRGAIEVYYPVLAKKMREAKSIKEAEEREMITEKEGTTLAMWLFRNNGEVKR